jgi:hypothetical protein
VRANNGSPHVSWGFESDFDGDGEGEIVFSVDDPSRSLVGGAFSMTRLQETGMHIAARWAPPQGEIWAAFSVMGDVDDDGVSDLFVAAPSERGFTPRFRSSRVTPTGATWGLSVAPDVTLVSLYTVGDLDRDGRCDLAGTFQHNEQTHPFAATLAGVVTVLDTLGDTESSVQVVDAGDVDADGYADLFFINRQGTGQQNCARWVPGGPRGVVAERASERCQNADTQWTYEGVAAAGDFDGDGDADLALTETLHTTWMRRVVVFAGGADPFAAPVLLRLSQEDALIAPPSPLNSFGEAVAFADTNADGFSPRGVTRATHGVHSRADPNGLADT